MLFRSLIFFLFALVYFQAVRGSLFTFLAQQLCRNLGEMTAVLAVMFSLTMMSRNRFRYGFLLLPFMVGFLGIFGPKLGARAETIDVQVLGAPASL